VNRLEKILETKRAEISKLLPRMEKLRAASLDRNDFRSLSAAIDQGPQALGLIAEVKKASPSAGVIAADFDPVKMARIYEDAGAHGISVLTDEPWFQGHLSYLAQIRKAVDLPLLRKDFILHEAQIFEAVVAGADAILLIVAALTDEELAQLHRVANEAQLEVLVEAHDLREVERALEIEGLKMLGINNRDLATFEVSLETSVRLAEEVPEDILLISESGIRNAEDSRLLLEHGANALLVGETLMRADDVASKAAELMLLS